MQQLRRDHLQSAPYDDPRISQRVFRRENAGMKAAVSLLLALVAVIPVWSAGIPATFSSRGVGGGGALYQPSINPADANEFTATCDMGQGLFTLDGGQTYATSDFRNYQVIQASRVNYCTDAGTGQHRLFTLDSRAAVDESSVAKPMMSAIITGAMTVNGAAWTKVTGWPNTRLANQVFADPNRIDRVIAIESNAGNSNPANLWVSAYDAATNGPKFPTTAATITSGALANKTRIAGVYFDGSYILLATNNGFYVSSDSGLTFAAGPALPVDGSGNARGFICMAGAKQGGQVRLYAISGPPSVNITFTTNSQALTSNLVWHMDWSTTGSPAWVQDMTGIDNVGTAGPPADQGDYPNLIAMAPGDISTVYVACGRRYAFPDVLVMYKKTSGGGAWTQVLTAMTNRTTYDNGNIEPGWLGLNTNSPNGTGGVAALSENGLGYNTPCGLCVNPSDVNDVIVTDNAFIHRTRNGGTDWHQLYTHTLSSTHVVGQKFAHGEDYSTGGEETTVCWWIDFTSSLMTVGWSDMKITQSADGVKWNFNYDHTKLIDDCYMAQSYVNATYPAVNGTRYIITQHTNSQYGYGANTDAQVNLTNSATTPGLYYLPPGGTTPLLMKDNWQAGTGNGGGTVRGNPMWITVDAVRDRLFVSVANSDPAIGGIWRADGLHNGAAAVVWTKLANPASFNIARGIIATPTRPFNVRVLDDHKLLVSYANRLPTSGSADYEPSSGMFYSTDDGAHWTDVSRPEMFYYTLDVVPDPSDPLNTWYACVWKTGMSSSQPSGSVAGGVWRTRDHGGSWVQIWSGDSANGIGASVTSITVNPDPQFPREAFLCTRYGGLYFTTDVTVTSVVWQKATSYPFRAPTRVFYDPNHTERIWITSNGNGLRFAYRPGSYAEWQAKNFGAQAGDLTISGPNADPDGDGLSNQMEYGMGTNPLMPTPKAVTSGAYGTFLSAWVTKNPVAADITWSAEASSDLVNWTPTETAIIQNDDAIFWARDIFAIGSVPRRFLHLKCSLGP